MFLLAYFPLSHSFKAGSSQYLRRYWNKDKKTVRTIFFVRNIFKTDGKYRRFNTAKRIHLPLPMDYVELVVLFHMKSSLLDFDIHDGVRFHVLLSYIGCSAILCLCNTDQSGNDLRSFNCLFCRHYLQWKCEQI